ncbi:2-oxo acid dehydrogenase subunit E2 [Persephonella sp.]
MEYKLVMPRLTDTMESGKIVRWLKKEGEPVKKNEPVLEVESDKAVMDVPSFYSGILKKVLHYEGEEVPVGEPIGIIDTEETVKETEEKPAVQEKEEKEEEININIQIPETQVGKLPEGTASPSAKKLAKELGINLKEEQEKGNIPVPAHEKDIENYFYSKYFSKEALDLAKQYSLDLKELYNTYRRKITVKDVKQFILENNIPVRKAISSVQKSLISSLSKSVEIPVFHIYEEMDTSAIPHNEEYTFTVWLLKIIGDVMQNHERTRAKIEGDSYLIYPNSSICVAVAVGEHLYAPVVKNINLKTLKEVKEALEEIKQKARENRLSPEDLTGSTFSISNLGMYGVKAFDAIIPPEHTGIVAVGMEIKGTTSMTFSFDHRIINGREAALFVEDIKKTVKDKKYIQKLKKSAGK